MQNGMIEKIEMINFMCHCHLTVEMSTNVTFIGGENGSGKSTIMAAMLVVFGASASLTQRVDNTKSFVKTGSSTASVSVSVVNRNGENRYNHQLFGDSIKIKRTFNLQGATRYEIKNIQGKVISTRKEDVIKIAEYFGIHIDNPLTFLSQETSKKFLTRFTGEERFRFFLEATNIDTLVRNNEETSRNVQEMEQSIVLSRRNIEEIENEMAVDERKIELRAIEAKLSKRVQCLEEEALFCRRDSAEGAWAGSQKEAAAIEKEIQSRKEAGGLMRKKSDKVRITRERHVKDREDKRDEYTEFMTRIRRLEKCNSEFERSVEEADRDVAQQTERLRQIERQMELEACGSKERVLAEMVRKKKKEIREKEKEMNERKVAAPDFEAMRAEIDEKKKEVSRAREKLEGEAEKAARLGLVEKNRVNLFGKNIEQVLASIGEERGFHRRPLGPIGMHIKLKEGKWSETMSAILHGLVTNFVVHDHHDRDILNQIFRRHQLNVPIIVIDMDKSDIPLEEPDRKYLTGLRVLEITNSAVRNTVVLFSSVEKILLIADRKEAEREMQQRPRNADFAYTDYAAKITVGTRLKTHFYGGKRDRNFFEDAAKMRLEKETQVEGLTQHIAEARQLIKEQEGRYSAAIIEEERRAKEAGEMQDTLKKLREEVRRDEMMVQNMAIEHGGDESALKEEALVIKESIERAEEQKNTFVSKKGANEKDIEHIQEEVNRIGRECKEIEKTVEKLEAQEREMSKLALSCSGKEIEEQTRRLLETKSHASVLLEQFQKAKEQTEALERPDPVREEGAILEELDAKRTALAEVQNTVEEKTRNVGEIKDRIAEKRRQKEKLVCGEIINSELIKEMGLSIEKRKETIERLKKEASETTNSIFKELMGKRGMRGELLFDFDRRTLGIQAETKKSQTDFAGGKENKMLSGGEKSYTMVCFLISLWESIKSPLRLLDEFDVFMDHVKRTAVISLLLKYAEKTKMQFIIITSQSLATIPDSSEIKKIRLKKSDRSQPSLLSHAVRENRDGAQLGAAQNTQEQKN
ncbi:MAG: Rad18-like recombination and DNA repair protein [Amphiamblys sp. WSBS2006]|nr:MAG: Rad18-like recombination and DNA repair protein [Amphiamblys sp. WSBS2006]